MRRISVRSVLGVAALSFAVLPMVAGAQCLQHDGLTYCPEGRAKIEASAEGVTVSNLSLSGADGVSVDLSLSGATASVGNRIVLSDEGATGNGYVQVAAEGLIQGEMGTIIRTTVWSTGGAVYISNDYPDMPPGDDVIAVVADDQIVGLFENLGEGAMVRLTALGGQVRFASGDRGLGSIAATLPNAVSSLELDLICPVEDPWDLWDLCQRVPCTGGDIALINTGGGDPVAVDVLSPAGEVLGSFESSTVMITRTGGDVPRSPFQIETITGAGFKGFQVQETRLFAPQR